MPDKVIHEIRLNQYTARPAELTRRFSLGTSDSYGVEQLRIVPGEGWDGLMITATFHPPEGEAVQVIVPADGLIDVPPEATRSGSELTIRYGKIVFAGVADGVQRISCNLPYTVMEHAPVDGAASSGTTPSWYEQAAAHFLPGGGKAGQVLAKASDTDLDVEWQNKSATPDWTQNDPTAADYIKNRPFYENKKTILEFDGNLEGKEVVKDSDGNNILILVSENIPTKEDLIGAEALIEANGETESAVISELEEIPDSLYGFDLFTVVYGDLDALSAQIGFTIPKHGVYLIHPDMMELETYKFSVVKEYIAPIEEKFLPYSIDEKLSEFGTQRDAVVDDKISAAVPKSTYYVEKEFLRNEVVDGIFQVGYDYETIGDSEFKAMDYPTRILLCKGGYYDIVKAFSSNDFKRGVSGPIVTFNLGDYGTITNNKRNNIITANTKGKDYDGIVFKLANEYIVAKSPFPFYSHSGEPIRHLPNSLIAVNDFGEIRANLNSIKIVSVDGTQKTYAISVDANRSDASSGTIVFTEQS